MKACASAVLTTVFILILARLGGADCPLDHLVIGCNRDGVEGTDDDRKLFVDCSQKYRDSGEAEYANWFYPLRQSIFLSYGHRIGEPGFDAFQRINAGARTTYDPNRALVGEPDLDYRVIVDCIALSPGLRAVHKEYPQFTIDEVGQGFSHSEIHRLRGDGHMHLSYQAVDGEDLHWITYRLRDALDDGDTYELSEPFTVIFNVEPAPGDLAVDGLVDLTDLVELAHYWLHADASRDNDYRERADANRDGLINFHDFALAASQWRVRPTD